MPIYGVHAFVWKGDWNNEIAPDTIRRTAEAGFSLLEIPLLRPAELDGARIRALLHEHNIRATTSLALPKDAHMPFYPERALAFLKQAVETTAAIGADTLAGCLYCHLGTLSGQGPTPDELETCANVLGEVARYAELRGIRLGLEPVNRYETYVLNTGEDTVKLIHAIGASNMFVHFDTYHMNIEEQGFAKPLQAAGPLCGYIHISESDRGIPGTGNVHWDQVFSGLKTIDFAGPLVLEAFAAINPDLRAATCLWRPRSYSAEELATRGLAFMQAEADRAGL